MIFQTCRELGRRSRRAVMLPAVVCDILDFSRFLVLTKYHMHEMIAAASPGRRRGWNMVQLRSIDSFYVGGTDVTLAGLPVAERRMAAGGAPRRIDPNG